MARDLPSRLRRSRAGRLPYAFVGVVVLAAMLLLTTYFESAVTWSNGNDSYNVPEEIESAFQLVQQDLSAAAYQDLMRAEAAVLATGPNPDLSTLNASVGTLFTGQPPLVIGGPDQPGTLEQLNLTTYGFIDGTVVVHAVAWGINVTWDEGQVYEGVSQVALQSDANDPNLALAQVPDASHIYSPGETDVPAYPMVVGWVKLIAYDQSTGVSSTQTVNFDQVLPSEIGLLQDSEQQFTAAASGPQGDFAQLVQYLATTLGQLRALAGYGSGGWLGPNSATDIMDTTCVRYPTGNAAPSNSILSCDDITDAVSLAEILMSLQYFHDYDPGAANAFTSSLPPGAYEELVQKYVSTGTIDAAALYLLLEQQNGTWFDNEIATGSGLAAAVDSFSDRYTYDLLDQFFGNQTVDPTLTDPVVGWGMIYHLDLANLSALLYRWLNSYQNWLGVSINSLPATNVTADIPAESTTVGACTYTILPTSSIQVSTNYVPNIADLILGTSYTPVVNNGVSSGPLPELLYNVWENASVDLPNTDGAYWSEAIVGDTEQAGYYFSDLSLLAEYDQSGGGASGSGLNTLPYSVALDAILNSTTSAIEYKPAGTPAEPVTDNVHTGYVNYLAENASKDGNNFTAVQAGLPDLTTLAGQDQALNTSYSLLTNGSNSILQGPYQYAIQKFATQATNSSWLNASFVNGADHPNLLAANASGPGGAAEGPYSYAMSDIARLTAREWFQLLYGLYYGTSGVIPTTLPSWAQITYNQMDGHNYHVVSPGVEHNAPAAYHEPDFAVNVMNETYISDMDWMGKDGTNPNGNECGGMFGKCAFTAASNVAAFNTCGAGGPGTPAYAAYQGAVTQWYSEEGAGPGYTDNTWNNVRIAVECALDGSNSATGLGGLCSAAPYNAVGGAGIDSDHGAISQSWWNIKNNTGDACFSTQLNVGCYNSLNFTNWTIRTFAAQILNDTYDLGEPNGWLGQIFQATDASIWEGANQTAIITKPYLENQVPYELWQGNRSDQSANDQLFNESLAPLSGGMVLTGDGLTLTAAMPTETIHLVDPQDDASNMGISPFSSSFTVSITGDVSLALTSERPVLSEGDYLVPTSVNYTVPMDVSVPITIYTPWEISSGWDANHAALTGDPVDTQTRAVLGLMFHDYHTAIGGSAADSHSYDYMPGLYVSPTLDQFFGQSVSIGKVLEAGGQISTDLLAALPDRDVGASAAWAQNLTLLENVTNTALNVAATATGGAYLAATQASLGQLNYDLTRPYLRGGPFNDVTFRDPAFFGASGTLNTAADQLNIYSSTNLPAGCQAAPSAATCYGDPLQYNETFAGPRLGGAYAVDNDFNAAPYPYQQGFRGSWGTTGAFSLGAYWEDFHSNYQLAISGGPTTVAVVPTVASHQAASLQVPYWGPTQSYPASISVYAVGGLTAPETNAFDQALASYLPAAAGFSSYEAEQQFAAGLLYDGLLSASPVGGATQFGYATALETSTTAGAALQENFSIALQDATPAHPIDRVNPANLTAFLAWYVLNHEALAYGLGANSIDPTTLASAGPFLLHTVYRNMTLSSGALGMPSTFAYLSSNLAASEADLGGTGGGLLCVPTVLVGGGTPGTFEMDGSLVTA